MRIVLHYLVIPKQHIPTVKNLQRSSDDFSLVSHMLDVGKSLLHRDAPQSKHYSLHSTVLITSTSTASHFLILQVSTGHEKNAYLHNFCPLAPGVWVSGK
ncbi:hypothetical protein KY290_033045 [Solanum tuberosum]|uniref:Uncharacterized protein n=1 Tax=Solanum tuberosum TaxID=4113 RepID=A0ABQ7TZ51_SOLTU|nr:hypothetical protein KY290_033045 [Solanum tuberosum]